MSTTALLEDRGGRDHGARSESAAADYLTCSRGLAPWLLTLAHKRIGVLYLVGILSAFLLGGLIALVIRLELFTPGRAFLSEDRYNELFTLHGAIMTFVFIIPSIPAALGNFLLPLMRKHRESSEVLKMKFKLTVMDPQES